MLRGRDVASLVYYCVILIYRIVFWVAKRRAHNPPATWSKTSLRPCWWRAVKTRVRLIALSVRCTVRLFAVICRTIGQYCRRSVSQPDCGRLCDCRPCDNRRRRMQRNSTVRSSLTQLSISAGYSDECGDSSAELTSSCPLWPLTPARPAHAASTS